MTVISLLRGVNVGGHHKIKMDALRELYASLGFRDVKTYLQSGNVVFTVRPCNLVKLARRIEDAIEGSVGFRPKVILRTAEEMKDIVERSPFTGRNLDPSRLVAVFFETAVDAPPGPEEIHGRGREWYVYYPNGIAESKLRLPSNGTARNWNTVTNLAQKAGQ